MKQHHYAALGTLLFILAPVILAQQAQKAPAAPRALPTQAQRWTGDFDGMVARRAVRVLVPYSRTLYYNDKGRERGITADTVRDFEQFINKKYA